MHESCFGGGTGAIHIGLQMASCDCNIELESNTVHSVEYIQIKQNNHATEPDLVY